MKCSIHDYVTRLLVASESDSADAYLVDLCAYPRGVDQNGNEIYNGACQCRHFIFRCEPELKKQINKGKLFRCKHLKEGRAVALDFILPYLHRADPNLPEDQQV